MVALEARSFYHFGEEWEFMGTNEYRDMIERIARSEDSVIGYFDRVCQELGYRDGDLEEEDVIDYSEEINGTEPDSVNLQTVRRLTGLEAVPDDSAAIWILANLGRYDLFEVGAYEMLNNILDAAEKTFYRFAQGGEYSNITLTLFDIESLREQVSYDPIRFIINRSRR
jgi:hypothetical protein